MTVKVGFLSCGSIGPLHVQAVQLCKILDLSWAAQIPILHKGMLSLQNRYACLHRLLRYADRTRPDAVVISAPNVRYNTIRECIEREIAILCEKPLATTTTAAKRTVRNRQHAPKKVCAVGICQSLDSAVDDNNALAMGDPIEFQFLLSIPPSSGIPGT